MILQKALTGQCNRGVKLMHGVLNTVKSSSWVSLTQRSQTLSFRWHCQVMAVIIMTSGSLYSGNQTKKCTRQPVLELKNHIFKKLIIYGYIFHSSDNARWAKHRTFELDIFAKSKPYSKHLQLVNQASLIVWFRGKIGGKNLETLSLFLKKPLLHVAIHEPRYTMLLNEENTVHFSRILK